MNCSAFPRVEVHTFGSVREQRCLRLPRRLHITDPRCGGPPIWMYTCGGSWSHVRLSRLPLTFARTSPNTCSHCLASGHLLITKSSTLTFLSSLVGLLRKALSRERADAHDSARTNRALTTARDISLDVRLLCGARRAGAH